MVRCEESTLGRCRQNVVAIKISAPYNSAPPHITAVLRHISMLLQNLSTLLWNITAPPHITVLIPSVIFLQWGVFLGWWNSECGPSSHIKSDEHPHSIWGSPLHPPHVIFAWTTTTLVNWIFYSSGVWGEVILGAVADMPWNQVKMLVGRGSDDTHQHERNNIETLYTHMYKMNKITIYVLVSFFYGHWDILGHAS